MAPASRSLLALVTVMLVLVVTLALTIVTILTDYWFLVKTNGIVSDSTMKENTYNYGFWRKCYEHLPDNIEPDDVSGTHTNCVLTYKSLVQKSDANITDSQVLVIHLSRSYIGLTIASAAAQLSTLLILFCGSWPGDCKRMQKSTLYISSSIVLLLATMAGIAGGICFMAAREVENKELHKYSGLITYYGWSFMLDWICNGLCLIAGFFILCLLRFSYQEVMNNKTDKYFYGS